MVIFEYLRELLLNVNENTFIVLKIRVAFLKKSLISFCFRIRKRSTVFTIKPIDQLDCKRNSSSGSMEKYK